MRELLERWAHNHDTTTDPETGITHLRCYLHSRNEPDGYAVVHNGFWHGWRVNPDLRADHPHIQAAVQEALGAHRGWYWQLESHNNIAGYASSYSVRIQCPYIRQGDYELRDTPAEALLVMYLKALESQAGERKS